MAAKQQAIIFDFDGTIADTMVAFARVFEDVTKRPEPLSMEEIDHLRGMSGSEFMQTFHIPKWKVPYMLYRGRQRLREHMNGIKLYPGIEMLIKQLHSQGIPLYIVSSNSQSIIQAYLQQQGLDHYFEAISGGASPFAKARKLLRLIDTYNIDINTSWCVGDETRDVIAAHAVGIKIISVSWGFNSRDVLEAKQPNVMVDTSSQLLKELQAQWKK